VIPYGHQSIADDDIAAVVEVLKGDWLTQGPALTAFEERLASVVEAKHAVAFANGTAALHGACAAAALGPGDRVATSTLSFSASATCAVYVGAEPVLMDIDPATLNLDPRTLANDIDALVAVHYAGLPVDLSELVRRPRIVIEDAAHAIGARTPDGPVGCCARSDMCCFSFHPVKTITTAEGGAVTTNDDALAARLRRFRNHGITPRPEQGGWFYEIDEIGFNYRLTDLQATLGSSQLRKLDAFLDCRDAIVARYRAELNDIAVELPPEALPGWRHGRHLFPIRVDNRAHVYDAMRRRGIGVQVHYVPIHRQPVYAQRGWKREQFPVAEQVYGGLLSLPLYPALTEADQTLVIDALREAVA
jgi:UDP-4-amino-4,6-dideoxy-N-acetyl-beta-L-altrosamine transaminase